MQRIERPPRQSPVVAKLGWADGIYSPAMDQLLGLQIYTGS